MMTPAKRFIVRTSLVTGSTVATLIGAQSLASLPALSTLPTPSIEQTTTLNNAVDSAPHVTIIRRAAAPTLGITPQHSTNTNSFSGGSTTNSNPSSSGFQIQPPVPVMVQAVQIPVQPSSRSSR